MMSKPDGQPLEMSQYGIKLGDPFKEEASRSGAMSMLLYIFTFWFLFLFFQVGRLPIFQIIVLIFALLDLAVIFFSGLLGLHIDTMQRKFVRDAILLKGASDPAAAEAEAKSSYKQFAFGKWKKSLLIKGLCTLFIMLMFALHRPGKVGDYPLYWTELVLFLYLAAFMLGALLLMLLKIRKFGKGELTDILTDELEENGSRSFGAAPDHRYKGAPVFCQPKSGELSEREQLAAFVKNTGRNMKFVLVIFRIVIGISLLFILVGLAVPIVYYGGIFILTLITSIAPYFEEAVDIPSHPVNKVCREIKRGRYEIRTDRVLLVDKFYYTVSLGNAGIYTYVYIPNAESKGCHPREQAEAEVVYLPRLDRAALILLPDSRQ